MAVVVASITYLSCYALALIIGPWMFVGLTGLFSALILAHLWVTLRPPR
jgi:hypothetical protein